MKELDVVVAKLREERKSHEWQVTVLDKKIAVLESLFEAPKPAPTRSRRSYTVGARPYSRITPGTVIEAAVLKVAANGGKGLATVRAVAQQLKAQGYSNRKYAKGPRAGGLRGRVATEMYRMSLKGMLRHVTRGTWEVVKT